MGKWHVSDGTGETMLKPVAWGSPYDWRLPVVFVEERGEMSSPGLA